MVRYDYDMQWCYECKKVLCLDISTVITIDNNYVVFE